MRVYKPCKNSEYADLAIYCNENDCHIAERATYYESVPNYHPAPVPPTKDEVKELRAAAYREEVDPITSHIQRLRDEEQTEEVLIKIAELIEERNEKVAAIKERYPYPEESGDESGDWDLNYLDDEEL